jgi:[acyl-carrier-protein] S-malonyltransferase
MKAAGAKRALVLSVGGAFHSPLMEPARKELAEAIMNTQFNEPICPIYQNYVAKAVTNIDEIKENLIAQLTAPVKWTQSVQAMVNDGATSFYECGPGSVLQGLVKKISKETAAQSV